jgi:hypothetical protein
MEFSQDEMGMLLTHDNNLLVRCPLTEYGMAAAGFMSEAMGIKVPALGTSLSVRVSTGVLFRVISIAELDYSVEESITILTRLLEEAELQRGRSSGSE